MNENLMLTSRNPEETKLLQHISGVVGDLDLGNCHMLRMLPYEYARTRIHKEHEAFHTNLACSVYPPDGHCEGHAPRVLETQNAANSRQDGGPVIAQCARPSLDLRPASGYGSSGTDRVVVTRGRPV